MTHCEMSGKERWERKEDNAHKALETVNDVVNRLDLKFRSIRKLLRIFQLTPFTKRECIFFFFFLADNRRTKNIAIICATLISIGDLENPIKVLTCIHNHVLLQKGIYTVHHIWVPGKYNG